MKPVGIPRNSSDVRKQYAENNPVLPTATLIVILLLVFTALAKGFCKCLRRAIESDQPTDWMKCALMTIVGSALFVLSPNAAVSLANGK